MSKHSLLLVDGDTRSLRVLEVSLRKAGFTVTSAESVQDALDKLEVGAPDLIISETTFPDGDGFELRRRVRASSDWADIPFVFLTAEAAIENKIRGLELGVDDYLTKPIYIKEIVARINILLQKRQRARFEERRDGRMRFAGRVADMPVVDVIQTIEISRKSGVIQFNGDHHRQGAIYFREGKVIDAEAGALQGEDAVYRLLTWSDGDFEVVFRTVRRRDAISTSSQGLLMEGMRRLDEWSRLLEQLPPLEHRFEIDTEELAIRLGEVPDDHNEILRLIDGKRTLIEVIDSCQFGDLECLQAVSRLYFEGLLIDLDHGVTPRRDAGKPVPLQVVEDSIAVPDVIADATNQSAPVLIAVPEPRPAGPELSSGYRPSTLRLIEEAVLAAQAVEPVLFDGPDAPGVIEMAQRVAREAAARALETEEVHAVPQVIEAEEPPVANAEDYVIQFQAGEPTPANGSPVTSNGCSPPAVEALRASLDDTGLRMIGSLGRDRAEASGELAQQNAATPVATTQREMVTILPRRITREVPVPQPPVIDPEMAPETVDEESINEVATTREPPPIVNVIGGTRRTTGPSFGAILLLVLAAVLVILAVLARSRHAQTEKPPAVGSAASLTTPSATASAPPIRASASVDAAPEVVLADSAPLGPAPTHAIETPPAPTPAKDPTSSPEQQALRLMTDAKAALDANQATRALELADRSLRLHRTTNTYIIRGLALQRLERGDEAVEALALATQLTPSSAKAWETMARITWSLHRWDDARTAMQRYLELTPSGDSAPEFRRRLTEPK